MWKRDKAYSGVDRHRSVSLLHIYKSVTSKFAGRRPCGLIAYNAPAISQAVLTVCNDVVISIADRNCRRYSGLEEVWIGLCPELALDERLEFKYI